MTEDLKDLALDAIAASAAADDPDYPRFHVVHRWGDSTIPMGCSSTATPTTPSTSSVPSILTASWSTGGTPPRQTCCTGAHHAPAVIPDSSYDRSGAYSGNAIVLEGTELNGAAAQVPYHLFYTGNLKDPVTDERTASQCLVTSGDLTDFIKWPGNPLIPTHAEATRSTTATARSSGILTGRGVPNAHRVQRADETGAAVLYRSRNLVSWELEGELRFPGAGGAFDSFGYMWECPGLVRLKDEDTGEDWDVLFWCPQGIEPDREGFENIFPCVYTVGHLVGY